MCIRDSQYDYAIRGLEAGVALTAKREDDKAIRQAFEALLAKKDWSELEALSHAAKSYHPTEVVEPQIPHKVFCRRLW